jgi:hypothetical protein
MAMLTPAGRWLRYQDSKTVATHRSDRYGSSYTKAGKSNLENRMVRTDVQERKLCTAPVHIEI